MRRWSGTCVGMVALLLLVGCRSATGPVAPPQKMSLFNGEDLSGWTLILSDPHADVRKVWAVRDGVVRCEGSPNGYMRTIRAYQDYRLRLEWRWPEQPANSGVLIHGSGPDKIWPRCVECQLQAGNAGDFVLLGGTGLTLDGQDRQDTSKAYVILPKKQASSEMEPGQWNTYEIVCFRDRIRCRVNGVLQNEGTRLTDRAGWIGLQSEGGPIEFRNITVEPVR